MPSMGGVGWLAFPGDRRRPLDAGSLAAAAGPLAAVVQFAGALKSTAPLAALPFDLTLAAAAALLPALALLLATRRWRIAPALGAPLAGAAGLWLWLVVAGAWSPSRAILAAKLPEIVLVAPVMLLAGLAIGAEAAARRRFCTATLVIGVLVAASLAWGLATRSVVLGGLPGANPELVRVQYQIAGLTLACAAGLAALRAVAAAELRRPLRALAWLALLGGLAAALLLAGGRAALLGLGLVVAGAPALALWRRGRPRAALAWGAGTAMAGIAGLMLVLDDPAMAAGLRTLERLTEGGAEASGRPQLWASALDWAGRAAPLGLGTGGFALAAGHGERRGLYPHNHALEALAEGGLPGLALWLLAFGGAAVAALRLGARVGAGRAAAVAALVVPVAVAVMVSTDLGNRMAWFALGLALSLGVEAERDRV